MNDRYYEIKKNILALAESEQSISAVIEIGSQSRKTASADEFSDLDVIIVCENYEKFLNSDEKMSQIGDMKISFVEDTFGGGKERRILFDDSLDVDFIFLNRNQMCQLLESGFFDGFFSRGYTVHYDINGMLDNVNVPKNSGKIKRTMTASEFNNIVNDFWFHTVWCAKKICRGELWVAIMCVNAYLKFHLLKVMELYFGGGEDFADVWHDGRFLEKWADSQTLSELESCFATYDKEQIVNSLNNTANLFSRLARACGERDKLNYPETAEENACNLIKELI